MNIFTKSLFIFILLSLSVFAAKAQTLKANFTYKDSCQGVEIDFKNTSTAGSVPIIKWDWTFTQGTTVINHQAIDVSTADAKAITFQNPGDVTVELVITDQNNNQSKITKVIKFKANIQARFAAEPHCSDTAFGFKNVTKVTNPATVVSYKFYYGDGNSETVTPGAWPLNSVRTHKYAKPGPYTISLVGYASTGCKDSFAMGVIVYGAPLLDLVVKPNTCADTALKPLGIGVRFVNRTKENYSYNTKFILHYGDGNFTKDTFTLQDKDTLLYYAYGAAGTYNGRLIGFTENGCKSIQNFTVDVRPNPVTDFTTPTQICQYSESQFFDKSSTDAIAWAWDFDDDKKIDATTKDPVFTYTTQGQYDVKLTTITKYGCRNTKAIKVNVINGAFIINSNIAECAGNPSSFSDYTSNVTVTSRTWDFGDGSLPVTTTGAANNVVTHSYTQGGKYNVKLSVTSDLGCTATKTEEIVIQPKPIVGMFMSGRCEKTLIQFTDTSKTVKGDSIISWSWNFGEGPTAVSTDRHPTYRYQSSGLKNITLEVTTQNGCVNKLGFPVTILKGPQAQVPKPSNACDNTPVGFTAIPQVGSQFVTWIFDDPASGADSVSTNLTTTHVFKSGKPNYQVKLVLKEQAQGCLDTQVIDVVIYKNPTAYIELTSSLNCAESPVSFNDSSDYIVNTKSRFWDFGDGGTSTAAKPNYTFKTAGTHNVMLAIENVNGCRDTVYRNIVVNPKPVANFTFTPGCRDAGILFLDSSVVSSGSIIKYEWDFGDGTIDSVMNPLHVFQVNNITFNVSLKVTTSNGCVSTVTKVVDVYPSPEPKFNFPTDNCAGNPVLFNNQTVPVFGSNPVVASYKWDFGDGIIENGIENPTHTFNAPGTYIVKLTVTNDLGCTADTSYSVIISPVPAADFEVSTSKCTGAEVTFTDVSSGSNITDWEWYLDNETTPFSFQSEGLKIFTTPGTYKVTLKVKTASGCISSVEKMVSISAPPVADFDVEMVCFGEVTKITNKVNLTPGVDYINNWEIFQGSKKITTLVNRNGQSPTYTFKQPGNYTIKLLVSSMDGCSDAITQSVQVLAKPKANFTVSSDRVTNAKATVSFDAVGSSGYDELQWEISNGHKETRKSFTYTFPTDVQDTGTYYVKLIAVKNYPNNITCTDTMEDTIYVGQSLGVQIPNAFTPGSDSINDIWKPVVKGEGTTYKLLIFNKWGQMVYKSNNIKDKGWSGDNMNNGVRQPEGVYMYYLQITDFSNENVVKYNGSIYLLE